MIAKNYRRFPEALALQLVLELVVVVVRRARQEHPIPPPAPFTGIDRRKANRDVEHEDFPKGCTVITPLGKEAEVIGYRGFRRGHRVWLVCRYLKPENKRFDKLLILPNHVRHKENT